MMLARYLEHGEVAQYAPGAQPVLLVEHGVQEVLRVDEPLHQRVARALAHYRDCPAHRLRRRVRVDELRAFRDAVFLHSGAKHRLVADEHSAAEAVAEGELHRLDGLHVRGGRHHAAAAETAAAVYHFVESLIHEQASSRFSTRARRGCIFAEIII